jgi:hypothetical protein
MPKQKARSVTGSATSKKSVIAEKVRSKINPPSAISRIIVRCDAGYPNNLFIRGKGGGLSWEEGVELTNIAPDQWLWESDRDFDILEFKVLLNDQDYETGSNRVLIGGTAVELEPQF